MEIGKYIQIAFIVVFAIFLFIYLLVGLKKGPTKMLIKLLQIILAAAISLLISWVVLSAAGNYISGAINGILNGLQDTQIIADLFDSSPSLEAYICSLAVGLVGPIVFLCVFWVIALLLKILSYILSKKLENLQFANERTNKLTGMACGVLCAFVASMCILMPFAGYTKLVSTVYNALEESELISTDSEQNGAMVLVKSVADAQNKPAVKITSTVTGFMFDMSTSSKVNNVSTKASKEIDVLIGFLPKIVALKDMDFSDLGNLDLTGVDNIIAQIDQSDSIKLILSEVIASAATKWYDSQTFLGINIKEQLPTEYKSALDGVLTKMKATTKDTVISDLMAFSDTAKALSKTYKYAQTLEKVKDTLTEGKSKQEILDELSNNLDEVLESITPESAELITQALSPEVLETLGLNEKTAEVVSEILSNTLTSVSELDEEARLKESEALNLIMSYASGSSALNVEDADQVVSSILESEALMSAIKTVASSNKLASITLKENQRAAIELAISDYENRSDVTPKQLEELQYLRQLLTQTNTTPTT